MTLIELMVGLTIGLVVVVAAVGSLASAGVSSRMVEGSTRLQQDASTAFRIIGSAVRQAGARRLVINATGSGQVVFNPDYLGFSTASGAVLPRPVAVRGTDGAAGRTDTLELHRDTLATGKEDSRDCLGEVTALPNAVISVFTVEAGDLKCDGSGPSGKFGFVSGVEDFQVWYGLNEEHGLRYVEASALGPVSSPAWSRVSTLRVCLRLVGPLTSQKGRPIQGCQDESTPDDGRLRRVFFRVFHLRNAEA